MQGIGPTHESALTAQGEGLRETGHQLDGFTARLSGDQRIGDLPALGIKRLNVFNGKVAFDDFPVGRMLRRIHRVGYRQVIRRRIAEGFVIFQHAHYILMAKQGPP
jgi:hypothetical protein